MLHPLNVCALNTTTLVKQVLHMQKLSALMLVLGFTMTTICLGAGSPAPYRRGVNYIPVMPAQPTSVNPGQIEVLEFFWYGDPHCFILEPYLESWDKSKPANLVLQRVPVVLNPQGDMAARAYYTAMQLGIIDKANVTIYDAMHANHPNLATEADYENFFTGQLGVSAKQFEIIWNSITVDAQISQAKVLAQRYGISNVPTLVVNGKWLTGVDYHLPTAEIMNATNWLVQREQTALSTSTQ